MSDHFLLDPDYQDFDFTDRDKLKFTTVYGEQHGNTVTAAFLLTVCSVFLVVSLEGMALDLDYARHNERTVGTVTEGCQKSHNWYVYSFKATDQWGELRQFTGKSFAGKDIQCRNVGDSIWVEYLRNAPAESSHELTNEIPTTTSIYFYIPILIFVLYGIHLAFRDLAAIRQARPRYNRLITQSIIIGGRITHTDQANMLLRPHQYLIEIEYEFWRERTLVKGKQIKRRDDLKGKPLPAVDTPVRILYADNNTYVML